MKKSFFVAGCVVLLSLFMVVTGCKKDDPTPSTPTVKNEYTVGSTTYSIQSALYAINDHVTTIGFISSGSAVAPINALSIGFANQDGIPTGTFNFSETVGGALWMNSDIDASIISGEINISLSGTTYTITISNTVLEDNQSLALTYAGTIELYEPEPPTPTSNAFTLGNSVFEISYSGYQTEEYSGEYFTSILFMDPSFENALYIACSGSAIIPTGTFELSSSNYQVICGITTTDDEYTFTSGTAIISKSGNTYTINIDGHATSSLDPFGDPMPATCHYEGALTELTMKRMLSFLK